MEDKIDLILLKIKTLEKKLDELTKTVDAHRVEHGFQKMQEGGVNSQFNDNGLGGMPGGGGGMPGGGMPGMGGMGQGYQQPGMGAPMQDPSRPPGM